MKDSLVTCEELREAFGGTTNAELIIRLEKQNIPYMIGKRGCPFTTFSAFNYSMGINLGTTPIVRNKPLIELE